MLRLAATDPSPPTVHTVSSRYPQLDQVGFPRSCTTGQAAENSINFLINNQIDSFQRNAGIKELINF